MAGLAAGLHILYNSVVQSIDYAEDSVRVRTASQIFEGDTTILQFFVVVTGRKPELSHRS